MVKSTGTQWEIINGSCPDLSGTQWNNKPEYCPTLSQVAEPDVTLPGASNRVAVQAEIDRIRARVTHPTSTSVPASGLPSYGRHTPA
jgi:hypothetical protein